jgi:ATP-dependent exoDNAse (exonuclease V) beta subunit
LSPTDPPIPDAPQRLEAADPRRSIIVQAPAGSGKTALLVDRFLNLLEIVDRPEEILAITFTRKAAAEMRSRISNALVDTDERAQTIRQRGEARGWQLDALAPRLRIQTIDGFCAALVRSLPIASRFGGALSVATDVRPLYEEAVNRTFDLEADSPLVEELIEVLRLFDNDFVRMRDALVGMLARRDQWLDLIVHVLRSSAGESREHSEGSGPISAEIDAAVERLHRGAFEDIEADLDESLAEDLARIARDRAARLDQPWPWAGLPGDLDGWTFIATLFSTRDGAARTRFGTAQGFASGPVDSAPKAEIRSLAAEFERRGLIEHFALLKELPTTQRSRDESHAIESLAAVLAMLVVELGAVFRHAGTVDFAEVTFAALRALGDADAPSDLAMALDYRIKHVLIDEFQDTSAIHHRLFARLTQEWQPGDGRTLFAVGDPMQSIYRFRDADVGLFQRTRRHGLAQLRPRTIELVGNFRSANPLIDWFNSVFRVSFGDREDPLLGRVGFAASIGRGRTRPDDGCTVAIVQSNDESAVDEAAHLIDAIERVRVQHPDESVAVLVRSRAHLAAPIEMLTARGIPWHGVDVHPLIERPVINDLIALLRAMSSDDDRAAWLAVLRAPFVGLTMRDLEAIAQAPDAARIIRDVDIPVGVSDDGRIRIERVCDAFRDADTWRGQARTRQWLESTFIRLGGADAYDDPDSVAHAQRLFELIDRLRPRIADIATIERAIAELYADTNPTPNAVELMTIHRAKGLEFDHVFLPSLHRANRRDDPPPIRWRLEGDHVLIGVDRVGARDDVYRWLGYEDSRRDANELVRLMYVAATRARHSLHLSAVLAANESGKLLAPPPRSLLSTIWPLIAGTAVVTKFESRAARSPNRPSVRRVLSSDYRWRPPE